MEKAGMGSTGMVPSKTSIFDIGNDYLKTIALVFQILSLGAGMVGIPVPFLCSKQFAWVKVVLCLLLGVLIYGISRDTTNIVGFKMLGWGNDEIYWLLPDILKYSLPDFLWLYAFTYAMILLWGDDKGSALRYSFISFFPIMAFLSEILQHFGILAGTFDWFDMVAYLLATILSLRIFHGTRQNLSKAGSPSINC